MNEHVGFTRSELEAKAREEPGLSSERIYSQLRDELVTRRAGQGLFAVDFRLRDAVTARALAKWAKENSKPVYWVCDNCVSIGVTFRDLFQHEFER